MKNISADFKSSLVVFLVALPLCLGIPLASHAPVFSGLIAGIIGGLVVALLSKSPLSISGPAASLVAMVAIGMQDAGGFQTFCSAVLISGLIQILFSLMRVGILGNFFPTSVIKGMLSSIGLVLILKQLPHILGFDVTFMGSESFVQEDGGNTMSDLVLSLASTEMGCVLIAVFTFAFILAWSRYSKKSNSVFMNFIPGSVLAVGLSICLNHFILEKTSFHLDANHFLQLPQIDGWSGFASQFTFPDWSAFSNPSTYGIGLMIAMVGSIESLLSIDAIDKIDPERRITPKNRELFAQGVGNIVSGLIGGLPISVVIARTSTNIDAGAKSKLSGVLQGLWILIAVLIFPMVMNQIPLAALAPILLLVGYHLTKPEIYIKMYHAGLDQFIPFIVTIMAILLTDLLKGICIGMMVGFFFVIRRNSHQTIVMVHDDEKKHYLIRLMKDISFLQRDRLCKLLQSIPHDAVLMIDGSMDIFIDADIIDLIDEYMASSSFKNIRVELKKSTTALSPFFRIHNG